MVQITSLSAALALFSLGYAQDIEKITPKSGPHSEIPFLGLGTWNMQGLENTTEAVAAAIQMGYRHLDCATAYQNQRNVSAGIKEGLKRTGLKRSDLWITTKIWSTRHGSKVRSGMDTNNEELGLDYVDMTLMHFPVGTVDGKGVYDYVETWKEMEKHAGPTGKPTRFIGISNFNQTMVEDLLKVATIKPKVHQLELHPYLQQQAFIDLHKTLGIPVTAYGPLGDTNPMYIQRRSRPDAPPPLLKNPVINAIATARGCTPAQVAIKWNMDRGVAVHPKSSQISRQKENYEAYTKCKLTAEDNQKIKDMEKTWSFRFWDICALQLGLPCYKGLQRDD